MIINAKINVTKVDKSKLFKGAKGTYLDVVLLENRGGRDQYGMDGMVIQQVDKKDRDAGQRGAILGNFKYVQRDTQQAAPPADTGDGPPESDDVPF